MVYSTVKQDNALGFSCGVFALLCSFCHKTVPRTCKKVKGNFAVISVKLWNDLMDAVYTVKSLDLSRYERKLLLYLSNVLSVIVLRCLPQFDFWFFFK